MSDWDDEVDQATDRAEDILAEPLPLGKWYTGAELAAKHLRRFCSHEETFRVIVCNRCGTYIGAAE
jgi:hypothetical protein